MSEATITIYFFWDNATPDPRPFQQQRHALSPSLSPTEQKFISIAVEIPLKHEYIYNSEKIIQAQLTGNETPDVVLTPSGMQYVVSKLEEPWPINENLGKETSDEDEPSGFDWNANEEVVTSNGAEKDTFDWDAEIITDEDDKPMEDEEFDWSD